MELHLTLYRAYSCKLKRFISPDPLGIDGGVNVYMWANMNPLWFMDPTGLINWKLVGKGFVGVLVNGAMTVGGAVLAETGVGAAVAVYGAYQTGASFGNIINGVMDQPEGPTGPVQTVTQVTMLVADVDPESRAWARADIAAQTVDIVVPTILAGKLDTRLITKNVGKPGTILGAVERAYISPEEAFSLVKAAVYANTGIVGYNYFKFGWDEFKHFNDNDGMSEYAKLYAKPLK